MKKEYKTIIVGAGASGLMLASLLKDKEDLLIIDANPRIGAKIAISGGGKCNVTNELVSSDNYIGVDWFVQSVLDRFTQYEVMEWFVSRGVKLELRKNGQYFCARSSDEIIEVFRRELRDVNMLLGTKVLGVQKSDNLFLIKSDRCMLRAENIVIASGGISFPKIGASSIGYDIAKEFGHQITNLYPSLVGFTLQKDQFFFKELSGASVAVEISTQSKNFRGDLLFAHRGISGPAVLNASLYWTKGSITIDFLPDFDLDSIRGSRRQLSTILPMPKKVVKAFLVSLDIDDKAIDKLSSVDWEKIKTLKEYNLAPSGTFGYSKAEVTRGGVSTQEIDPYNLMSLKIPDLYFAGEVLDVTGELGGYNFQWAFSSAKAVANNLNY